MDNLNQNKHASATLKILCLGFLSFVLLVINWFLIEKALYGDKTLVFWVVPGLTTILSISFLTLYAAVNNNRKHALVFGIATVVAYIAIFPKDPIVMLAGAIFLILMFLFEQRIRTEERSRQGFSIRRLSDGSINVIIYAFLLLLGLNIYYNTSADFKANPDGFYEALGQSAAKSTRYLTGGEANGGIDLTQTLDEYLETETRKQVPDYDTLPEDFRQQYLEETKQQFFRQFNVQIPSNQPLSEVVAQFAVDRVRTSAEKYTGWFPLIFTLIILAFLRTFSFILRWLSLLFTWLLYKLSLKIKFLRLSKVMIEVEKLEI